MINSGNFRVPKSYISDLLSKIVHNRVAYHWPSPCGIKQVLYIRPDVSFNFRGVHIVQWDVGGPLLLRRVFLSLLRHGGTYLRPVRVQQPKSGKGNGPGING
uniref:(northern house mosquito) hypothetical protein n=1 Tax=Culex pipiens TaxID=7175 RepID=A0A8D8ASU8_CULPI